MVNLYQFTVTTHTKERNEGGRKSFPKEESAHAQTGKKKILANETVEIKFYFKLPFYNYCQSYVYTHVSIKNQNPYGRNVTRA